MGTKKMIWLGLFVGSVIGGYIPALWGGGGLLSFSSLLCSSGGALIGIWAGFKLGND